MARHLHLVRHGEVDNPQHVVYATLPGFELSELGRVQAKEAARYLSSQPIVAVWSSPLERALSTAAVIAARAGLPVSVDEELIEWRIADDWAGIVWEELPTTRPGELEAYLEHPWDLPFARESLTELAARMRGVLQRLHERHVEGDVVVVSHQDPVQAARLAITGRSLEIQHEDKPQHCSVITLRPGSQWHELTSWTPDQGDSFPPDA
jgi:broad specificity phosphatase PhoE